MFLFPKLSTENQGRAIQNIFHSIDTRTQGLIEIPITSDHETQIHIARAAGGRARSPTVWARPGRSRGSVFFYEEEKITKEDKKRKNKFIITKDSIVDGQVLYLIDIMKQIKQKLEED